MRLSELIHGLGVEVAGGFAGDPEITGVAHDSRTVEPGDLFVATVGQRFDGRAFVRDAVARGAAAIAGPACMAFVATMPNSQGGIARASLVALGRPLTSPAPTSRSPFRAIASTCAWLRSNAHTSTSSSVARLAANSDPTAPQPTTQTFMASPLVRRQDAADAGDQARTRDRRSVRTAAGRAPAP